jgi:hypothetical protein
MYERRQFNWQHQHCRYLAGMDIVASLEGKAIDSVGVEVILQKISLVVIPLSSFDPDSKVKNEVA